jgi:hypothetical protein
MLLFRYDPDLHSPEKTEQRLKKLLERAFSGPPKPLKDIPKRNGKSRTIKPGEGGKAS